MITSLRELPAAVWGQMLRWTVLVVAGSSLLSVAITYVIMEIYGKTLNGAGLTAAIALPILIGTPLTVLHLLRLSQLRMANQKLQVLASTDWLTACLNRRAFTHQVSGQLHQKGAFLVIDADHFKFINDRFGHDRGDEVLQLMATTIKQSVRENDIVGRIGGEEFGVFLRGANLETAQLVAERIRASIANAAFMPDGMPCRLSVSVGGAFFDRGISFSELFRIADQRLYGVKQTGRNRTDVTHAAQHAARGIEAPGMLN